MKKGVFFVSIFILFFSILSVSADIIVSQPAALYNLGDTANLSVTLTSNDDANDFFTARINCQNSSLEIMKSVVAVGSGQSVTLPVSIKLDKKIIGSLEGKCEVMASYDGNSQYSAEFEISSKVDISIDFVSAGANPGDSITISGKATKANGKSLNGFAIVNISDLDLENNEATEDGNFELSLQIPDDSPAGSYKLLLATYEREGEFITNNAHLDFSVRVNQVVRGIDLALSSDIASPGKDFVYTPVLNDQTGVLFNDNVKILVYRPDGILYLENSPATGEAEFVAIPKNETPGSWKIAASYGNFSVEKQFRLEELEEVTYTLENNTLSVKNTGNVPYNKSIEVYVGNDVVSKEVSLNVGESKRLKISAPSGTYDISVKKGEGLAALGSASLTGRAIALDDYSTLGIGSSLIWLWAIVILVLLFVALYLSKNVSLISYLNKYKFSSALGVVSPLKRVSSDREDIITQGQKEKYIVAAIKVKNSDQIVKSGANAADALDRAVSLMEQSGGKSYTDGDFRVIAFPAGDDKEHKADVMASIIAAEKILIENNRRHAYKADYGIGVHIGELIVESKDNKFKFISWGNTISLAKKIAEFSKQEVLMSEALHMQTVGKVKFEQVPGSNAWKVKEVVDRNPHSKFIQRFMDKNKGK